VNGLSDWIVRTAGVGGVSAVDLLAAADLSAFTVVIANGNIADSNNMAHCGHVIGIALSNIAAGFIGVVATSGEVTNPAWTWLRGDVLYLNGTALSTTPPSSGFLQQIAIAQATTKVIVDMGPAILL
jgi:predicted RecA/RadA family phage recombinase